MLKQLIRKGMGLAAFAGLGLAGAAWAAAPVASFTATPDRGYPPPVTVVLDAGGSSDSDGAVTEHNWTIDGIGPISLSTSTDVFETIAGSVDKVPVNGEQVTVTRRTMTIAFKAEGTYTVGLVVKDNDGELSSEVTHQVRIGPDACDYTLTPVSAEHGAGAESGTITVDTQDGCDWSANSNVAWAEITQGDSGTGSGTVEYQVQANPTPEQRAGTLTIGGETFPVTQAGQTPNLPPVAAFTANPDHGPAPLEVTLDYSGSYDPEGGEMTFNWEVDGVPLAEKSGVQEYTMNLDPMAATTLAVDTQADERKKIATFTYPDTYRITLTVTDDQGQTDQAEQTVVAEVPEQPPVASFTATPASGPAPLEVTLNGSASSDPDGEIVEYIWKDNGQTLPVSGSNPTVTLETAGTHIITLEVVDDDGLRGETQQTVTVIENQPPVASFTTKLNPGDGRVPLEVTLDYSASNDPDGEIVTYRWEVDNVPLSMLHQESQAPACETTTDLGEKTKIVRFTTPASYIIALIVTDNHGLITKTECSVTATAAPSLSITPENHHFGETEAPGGEGTTQPEPPASDPNAAYHPNRVIVKFKPDANAGLALSLSGPNVAMKEKLESINAEVWEVEDVDAFLADSQALATNAGLGIEYIERDYLLYGNHTPNDPKFGSLWGMHNTGQTGGSADADIDAPAAWDKVQGGDAVVCAVIDTGVDYTHPDLAANMWRNPNASAADKYGYDFFNNDPDPRDDHGHGTHVAGTIAAEGDNGVGVSGVNWQGKIAAVKFLSAQGYGYTTGAIKAVTYAKNKGFRCINASWAGSGYSQALYDAIKAFGSENDGLFIAAAANSGADSDRRPMYPAAYDLDNIVSVCATDHHDRLAAFSNYGARSVDLCAPGVEILSTLHGNRYAAYSGTSMAAPHVAGAVALLWNARPELSAAQVKVRLLATVDSKAGLQGRSVTGGRLNLAAALREPLQPQAFTVTNRGGAEVTLAEVKLDGQDPTAFAIQADTCSGNTLAADAVCSITVAFVPVSAGAKQAQLVVVSDSGVSVVTAGLSGNAVADSMTNSSTLFSGVIDPVPVVVEQASYILQTGEAYLPAVAIAGDNTTRFSAKLCLSGSGAFSVCDFMPQADAIPGTFEPVNAVYDPVRGVLEIPFIQVHNQLDSGEVMVVPGGYMVELEVLFLPDGSVSLPLSGIKPIW